MFCLRFTTLFQAMPSVSTRALAAVFQSPDQENSRLMIIFMGIAAISLLILALVVVGVLVALAVLAAKASAAVSRTVQEVKVKAYPIIEKTNSLVGDLSPTIKDITQKTQSLLEELSPRITGISDDLHGITTRARNMAEFADAKLHDFEPAVAAVRQTILDATATARSANDKTARQVDRVNELVTGVLSWTETMTSQVERGISGPVKQLAGLIERIKAKADSIVSSAQQLWAKAPLSQRR